MKFVGTSVAFNILFIFLLCWSAFSLTGALYDSGDEEEPTLEIQPTVLASHNISDISDAEASINPSEGNLVPNNEAHSGSVIESHPTDVLEAVPEAVYFEVGSDHAGVSNEIINNDTPIVISPIDSATEELEKRANIPSPLYSEDTIKENVYAAKTNITVTELEEDNRSDSNATTLETEEKNMPKNLTDKNAEDIPSFSEWAQKHLEEVEKKEQVNFSTPQPTVNNTKQGSGAKLRWKNYASVDCGAKVILANSEAHNTWAILVGSRDEYILNPCNSRLWFIVELCEAIQLKKIDLANYELFSSSPEDFTVSVSDRFPTRDWSVVGQFTAKNERDVQNFDINTETFGKYVKVEIKSHYGSEYYCPLSLFRAYGMSVFEVLQKEDPAHEQPIEEDDDDDDPLDHSSKGDTPGNLLSSATDAVLSMVKKAAQVLGNKVNKTNESSQINNEAKSHSRIIKTCSSPSHYVVCNNCSDMLFGKIFELLSCKQKQIANLVSIPYISKALMSSMTCHSFGFDFRDKTAKNSLHSGYASVESFFPENFLGAMCNALAVTHNKVLFNISHQYANTTENISSSNLVDVDANEPKVIAVADDNSDISNEVINQQPTEALNLDQPDVINSKSSCSTDTTYASQIKPSKSFSTELPIQSEVNTASISSGQSSQYVENVEFAELPEPSVVDASTEVPSESELQPDSNVEENVDKLITELNTEASPSVVNTPTAASNLQGQKESVFLRLSNRIKALERNMSLSSQYLEELSKRYKKQVEEMQRVLERTEQALNEVTAKKDEQHRQLEEKLEFLTRAMENRNSWQTTTYWIFFVICFIFLVYCFNRYSASKSAKSPATTPAEIQRRNSVDVVTRVVAKKKKRRPSDQALKIVTSASGDQEKHPKKRKKKSSNPSEYNFNGEDKLSPLCSSSKIWDKQQPPSPDWVEGRGRVISDIPFALEESDCLTLETLPFASELSAIEGPAYARTAAHFRLGRSSLRNGKVNISEEIRRQSSPESSVNGSISSVQEQTPKKEKKGFKKLFKKVF